MEDSIAGNELALMEENDLLREDLAILQATKLNDPIQNIQEKQILMIEASNNSGKTGAEKGSEWESTYQECYKVPVSEFTERELALSFTENQLQASTKSKCCSG